MRCISSPVTHNACLRKSWESLLSPLPSSTQHPSIGTLHQTAQHIHKLSSNCSFLFYSHIELHSCYWSLKLLSSLLIHYFQPWSLKPDTWHFLLEPYIAWPASSSALPFPKAGQALSFFSKLPWSAWGSFPGSGQPQILSIVTSFFRWHLCRVHFSHLTFLHLLTSSWNFLNREQICGRLGPYYSPGRLENGAWGLTRKRIRLQRDMALPISLVTVSDFILPSYWSFFHNGKELSFFLLSDVVMGM